MTGTDDIDMTAAEYVIGTLDAAERTAVAARRLREQALDAEISAWEQRLSPLDGMIAPVTPPEAVKRDLMARIAMTQATAMRPGRALEAETRAESTATVISLERRLARWRMATLGASAIAASLAGVIGYRDVLRPTPATTFVAVLQKDAASPAFLMTVDVSTKTFTVRTVAAERQPGKSYELWLVHEKLGAPKSLGLLNDVSFTTGPKLAPYATADIEQATYAVSLEPEGGSTTGAPTGPVVYAGKLVQTKP